MSKENFIDIIPESKFRRKIIICLDDYKKYYDYTKNIFEFSLDLTINTNKDDSFEKCIQDKEGFKEAIDSYNVVLKELREDFSEMEEESSITYDEFFSKDYTVEINGSVEDIIKFVNNSNIKSKKIVLAPEYGREVSIKDNNFIDKLANGLNNLDNIYVQGSGNTQLVKLIEYKNTIEYIDNIVKRVEDKNFSPIEKLLYVYDIVRDRKYIKENEGESYSESRDLTSVTSGEKIVCLGFAEIFDKALKKLEFNSKIHQIVDYDKLIGHARVAVYVKDDKYNIDGIYMFDPTYNCKKNESNKHFDSYVYFAKTASFFKNVDDYHKDNFVNDKIESLNSVVKKIREKEFDKIKEEEVFNINSLYMSIFNNFLLQPFEVLSFSDDIEKDNPINLIISTTNKEEIYNKILEFNRLFNKEIPTEVFMKALTTVRSNEYYEDEEKFPISIEKILEITKRSVRTESASSAKVLAAIFGDVVSTPEDIIEEEKLDKQINGVRLSKTLRKVLNKKANK